MPYEYLTEVALTELVFRAWGETIEEVFQSAADALVQAMSANPEAILPRESRTLRLSNTALDMLLFDLLQEMIYYRDTEKLLLAVYRVEIKATDDHFRLTAEARGEYYNPQRHQARADIKAVTLHRFQLERTFAGWEAKVALETPVG